MNFIVYTRNGCPYCTQVKQVLSLKGLPFTEQVLDRNFSRSEFYSKFGKGSTFPQVIMDGKNLGGCTETVKYLRENNIV
jgi:glutaredoxin